MSHKILTVVCALVLGLSISATAAVQNVKVGGDIDVKGVWQSTYDVYNKVELIILSGLPAENTITLYTNDPVVKDYLDSITRVYVEASLTDNVSAHVRVINERDWNAVNDENEDVSIDLAYLTLAEMYGYPFSLTIGRQEIKLGEGFLVGDGTRGSEIAYQYDARKAFDAIKAVWDYDPHTVTLLTAKVTEGSNVLILPRNTDTDLYGIDWNYDGGVYGLWDFALIYNTMDPLTEGTDEIWAFSVRGEGSLPQVASGTLALKGEVVREWGILDPTMTGTGDSERLDAWGGYLEGEYTFDNAYAPYFGLGYIYMSGDERDSDEIELFIPLYEDEKYGEIAEVVYGMGATNPAFGWPGMTGDTMITNASIWKLSAGFNPTENTTLDFTYYNFYAAEEVISYYTADTDDQNRQIGSEYDLTFTYNYSEDVTFGLMYALFIPGKFFELGADESETAALGDPEFNVDLNNAQELIGSVKVTF